MDIREIEEILGRLRLKNPQHIIIVNEPVVERFDGVAYYRGLAERFSDTIVLSSDMKPDTVIHEVLHTVGIANEFITQILSNILLVKAKLLPAFLTSKPKYIECSGCERYKILHEKYKGRATHYVKV